MAGREREDVQALRDWIVIRFEFADCKSDFFTLIPHP